MIARGGRSSPRMPARYIQYLEVRKGGKGLQPPGSTSSARLSRSFTRPTVVTFASFADQDFHELLQIDETILVQIIGLELTEWGFVEFQTRNLAVLVVI
jgi:hypothetical protein